MEAFAGPAAGGRGLSFRPSTSAFPSATSPRPSLLAPLSSADSPSLASTTNPAERNSARSQKNSLLLSADFLSPQSPRRRPGVAAAATEGLGFLSRLGRVLKEKATSDFDRVFKGVTKTREKLAVVDELLLYWNLNESDRILEELEEALLVADFGPATAIKVVDSIRRDVGRGKLKTGEEIKAALKKYVVKLMTDSVPSTELKMASRRPTVMMVIGVNGGGKTTTLGKLAHRLTKEGAKVLFAAGDTFRAAASEQLEVWAERTQCDIVTYAGTGEKVKPAKVMTAAVKRAVAEGYDVLLADTSGRLHTNYNLMEELKDCKSALKKSLAGSPHEVLMVLDGTTGLNMLIQASEFHQLVGVTGFVLTKLDGTARGGCVVSVVDQLHIPVKFIGVGEGLEDLQPFDAEAFVGALIP